MDWKDELSRRHLEAEEIVYRYLPEETGFQETIMKSSNYSVKVGGKRLRPIIMKAVYELFGGSGQVIEPFMAGMEYIHNSSLVHDDLPCMDNDVLRRGHDTTWVAYGEAVAVLAGDALLMYAMETASKAFYMDGDPVLTGRAVHELAMRAGIYGMIGGQTVDVEMTGKPLSKEQLHFIYDLKTGALLKGSMCIGAILGGAADDEIKTIEKVAENIGFAFQIQDDILDVISTTEELGKPVLSDEKNDKTTYVTFAGLDNAKKEVERLSDEAVLLLRSLKGDSAFLCALTKMLTTRKY